MMKSAIVIVFILIPVQYLLSAQTRYNANTAPENIEKYNEIEPFLPDENTYIPSLGFSIRHPEGWVMSSIRTSSLVLLEDFSEWGEPPMYNTSEVLTVFAPEIVTLDNVYGALNSIDMPMLIVQPVIYAIRDGITYDVDVNFGATVQSRLSLPQINLPYEHPHSTLIYRNFHLHLVTYDEDWDEHREQYSAMLEFPETYQFITHPDLKQLFLWWDFYFGYPETWEIETIDGSTENDAVGIMLSVSNTLVEINIKRGSLGKAYPTHQFSTDDPNIQSFLANNNIVKEDHVTLLQAINDSGCDVISPPLYFSTNETHGFIRLYRTHEITISVDSDIKIDEIVLSIINSFFEISYNACG